jgi:acetyl-CoA acetyltransferase family protein
MPSTAENVAQEYQISREDQDAFAQRSQERTAKAQSIGRFATEIVPVSIPQRKGDPIAVDQDEHPRLTSLDALAKLKPIVRKDGTVTAGNASQLSDGAAALLLGDRRAADGLGVRPLARVAASAVHAVEPQLYGIAPVEAANTALARAGIGWADLSVVELNEAFAAQALACLDSWPDLDPDIVNPNGGAVALGHPIGCSGARILGTLARELRRRGGRWGLAAICIGVGQGLAVVLEA